MGEVWLARHALSGGLGAVKVLAEEGADARAMLASFRREARAIGRLRHPHIVMLFEVGESHLVYQYVDGQDLARRLRTPMEPSVALRIARQIASALSAAHEAGVVHRDVKPANVLLDKQGNAYLSDFGIAIATEDAEGVVIAGTRAYAPPEQWIDGRVSPLADQYALGRTLAEMLVGGHLTREASPALELPATLPSALRDAIARATHLDRSSRFPHMRALEEALAAVDVSALGPPLRLAPLLRSSRPFGFARLPRAHVRCGPDLERADHSLRAMIDAEVVDATAAHALLAELGLADLAFSLHASNVRMGPLSEPTSLARATSVVVLMHGWAARRDVWQHAAPAIARDDAQAIVIAPDLGGFGDSRFAATPTYEQLAPAALRRAALGLVSLLRLDHLPTVLVGHSVAATSLLTVSDRDLGAQVSRVAISPVLPAYSEEYRARVSSGVRLAKTVGRFAPIRRMLLERLARDAPSVRELTADVRRQMADEALAIPGTAFAETFQAVLDTPRFERGPHHRLLLLIGDNDPLVSEPALEAAVRDLGTTPVQLVRLATGGHHPHLESAAHPEWTARNVAEIVYLVSQMLLTASQDSDAPAGSATTVPAPEGAKQDTAAETVPVRRSS